MPPNQRAIAIATRQAQFMLDRIGTELRAARLERGLSQRAVAEASGTTQPQVSRIERGLQLSASIPFVVRLLTVVGLEGSFRAYPAGQPVRDSAHRALLDRLAARVQPPLSLSFEMPLPIVGDKRAWDAALSLGKELLGVEAETRPTDVQSLQRRVALKLRDDPRIRAAIILLADTRHNREMLREHGPALARDYPLQGAAVLHELEAGRLPKGGGVVLL